MVLPGDLNGDGFDDFVVGAASWTGDPYPGRVHVFFGGPLVDSTSDLVLNGQAQYDRFGYAVASAGDVNGDGYVDLVVGAYQNDAAGSNAGRAYVYFGGPGLDASPDLVLTGEAAGDEFGIAVAGIGDANADGWDDIVVGARFHRVTAAEDGRAYVYFGGPDLDTVPDVTIDGQAGERLGFSVSSFDDLNGDGRAEFVVGAYYGTSATNLPRAGRAYVCTVTPSNTVASTTVYGYDAGGGFSDGLAAGDVDGDARPDLLVGASAADGGRGRVYVYSGGPGFDTVPDLHLSPYGAYEAFGRSLSGGADLDGDGFGDLVVGAPRNTSGVIGSVYLFRGGPALDAGADRVFPGMSPDEYYGWSVAAPAASDVDLDGRDDLLVGATFGGPEGRGRAEFPLDPCLSVDCPSNLTVDTGQAFVLEYTVSSCDDVALDLEYTVSNSDAWCPPATGAFTLDPGASFPIAVTCTAPDLPGSDFTNSFVLAVRVLGCSNPPAVTCTRTVTRRPVQPVITCSPDVAAEPGSTVTLNFSIHNPSAAGLAFNYAIADTRGWCPPVTGLANLGPGMTGPITRICTIPSSVPCDVQNVVTFSARNAYSTQQDWVTCETRMGTRAVVCPEPICPRDTTVTPGEPFAQRLRIVNCSTTTETFDYVVVDDQGWGPPVIDSVTIAGRDTASVFATFVAPIGTPCGTFDVLRFVVRSHECATPLFTCDSKIYVAQRPDALLTLVLAGPAPEPGFGIATAMPGDLNGDGFDDLVVGAAAPEAEGDDFPGRVYVYLGGPGTDTTPDFVLSGEAAGDRFGYAVAGAGDVNSDGHSDLAVGAYRFDLVGTDRGRVYIYYGGPGFDAVPDFATSGLADGEHFGIAVAGVGDVTSDGHDDYLVGARLASVAGTEAGRAYLYSGGPTPSATPTLVLEGQTAGERFGFTVSGGGDLNGDLRPDFLVGAHYNPALGSRTGRVYAYYGGPSLDPAPDLVLTGQYAGGSFGDALAAVDVSGDGHPDILVGASSGAGSVFIYLGGPGIDNQSDLQLAQTFVGGAFGRFVSGGADFDQDGFADFVVGAPGFLSGPGHVFLYFGGPRLDAECDGALTGESPGDQYGFNGTATGADVNADGAPDLLVGAFRNAGPVLKPNAGAPGRAYLYSALYPIPVVVEDWSADWDGRAVTLEWKLAGITPDEDPRVLVQRADAPAGPYIERVVLPPVAHMSFVDSEIEGGRTYWYRLALDLAGETTLLAGPFAVVTTAIPVRTALDPPFEMPGGRVRIAYRIGPTPARVVVDVYDIAGRLVRRLEPGLQGPGPHALVWDERDGRGLDVARGVYLVRLVAGLASPTRKVVVLRP